MCAQRLFSRYTCTLVVISCPWLSRGCVLLPTSNLSCSTVFQNCCLHCCWSLERHGLSRNLIRHCQARLVLMRMGCISSFMGCSSSASTWVFHSVWVTKPAVFGLRYNCLFVVISGASSRFIQVGSQQPARQGNARTWIDNDVSIIYFATNKGSQGCNLRGFDWLALVDMLDRNFGKVSNQPTLLLTLKGPNHCDVSLCANICICFLVGVLLQCPRPSTKTKHLFVDD